MKTRWGRAAATAAALIAATALQYGLGPAVGHAANGISSMSWANGGQIGQNGGTAVSYSEVLTVYSSGTTPAPGVSVYLSLGSDGTTGTARGTAAEHGGPAITGSPTPFTTDTNGQVAIDYFPSVGPVPPNAVEDVVTAQDAATTPAISQKAFYKYSTITTYQMLNAAGRAGVIAAAGSLSSSTPVCETLTLLDGANHQTSGSVYFKLAQINGSTAVGGAQVYTAGTSACTQAAPVTTDPHYQLTSQPTVPLVPAASAVYYIWYTAPTTTTSAATDQITTEDTASGPGPITATAVYSVHTPSSYAASPAPIAAPGSLSSGTSVVVTVTVKDSGGAVVPGTPVYLTGAGYTAASSSSTYQPQSAPTGQFTATCLGGAVPAPGASRGLCYTDGTGTVQVSYKALTASTGTDVLEVFSAASGGSAAASAAYSYGAVSCYALTLSAYTHSNGCASSLRIAPRNSLSAATTFADTAIDSAGNPVAIASYFLAISTANPATHENATVNSNPTVVNNGTPSNSYATDGGLGSLGVTVTYTPDPTVTGGTDIITASNADNSASSTAFYQYGDITGLGFTPNPIAPAGSLGANASQPFTLALTDGSAPGSTETVYLKLTTTASGGGQVFCGSPTGGTQLNSTFKACSTSTGSIALTYVAPAAPVPGSGTDLVTAQDGPGNPIVSATDSYTFATTTAFVWSPAPPIGPAGTLLAGSTHGLTVTAYTGPNGNVPVQNGEIYLSFHPVSNASVTVSIPGGVPQPSSPGPNQCMIAQPTPGATSATLPTDGSAVLCTADSLGSLTMTYTVASPVPSGGADLIRAQAASTFVPGTTIHGDDTYTYTALDHFTLSPDPIASPGSLAAATQKTVTVTAYTASGAAANTMISLSFAPTNSTGATAVAHGGNSTCPNQSLSTTPVTCETDAGGHLTITYTVGTGTNAYDTITAADTTNTVQGTDIYSYDTPSAYSFSPVPIASAGSLNLDATQPVQLTVLGTSGHAVPTAPVNISLANPGGGTAYVPASQCTGTAGPQGVPVSTSAGSPTQCTADSGGHVAITYVAASTQPDTSAGAVSDQLTAAPPSGSSPSSVSDSYTYNVPTLLQLAPFPIGPSGTTPGGTRTGVYLMVHDAHGHAVPNVVPGLTFSPTSSAHPATATVPAAQCSGTTLSATATSCVTDNAGIVLITYTTGDATTGTDQFAAVITTPSLNATDSYTYTHVAGYTVSPVPIAADGSLAPSTGHVVQVITVDASNAAVPYGAVMLSLSGPGSGTPIGTATVPSWACQGITTLPSSPLPCITDSTGHIPVTYTPPTPPTAGGVDTLMAQNTSSSPTMTAGTTYTFLTVGTYAFSTGGTIASQGSLGTNGSKSFAITVQDTSNPAKVVPYSPVTLTLGGDHNGPAHGSAFVTNPDSTHTPIPSSGSVTVDADSNGVVNVTYTTPSVLPANGLDALCASNASSNPTVVNCSVYAFPTVTGLSFSPNPIAVAGTLGPNSGVNVVLAAVANTGSAATTRVFVAFNPTPGGGRLTSPQCSPTTLGSSAVGCVTDGSGHVALTYTTPGTLPSSGTDTIVAQDAVSSPAVTASTSYVVQGLGYWLVASDGGIFSFGSAQQHFHGSTGNIRLNRPIVGMAAMPDRDGYFLVASDGGIFTFGSAVPHFHGSTGNMHLNAPIVGMALMPDGDGYFLVASDGGIFSFGSAVPHFHGSTGNMHLNAPIVGMALMPDGDGYFLVASDGGIFSFGSAVPHFHGSTGNIHLNQPIVGMALMPDGDGYFLVASDGGIFSFGSAVPHFHGSTGNIHLNQPIVGMALMPDGDGYFLVASDGGIFTFGSAAPHFLGSTGNIHLNQPVVGMALIA